MILSDNYLLKEIADFYVLIPVGQNIIDYKHMIDLNKTSGFICKCLETEMTYEELLNRFYMEYSTDNQDKPILKQDLDEFLEQAKQKGIIKEEKES